jgi:hypothetical protein
MKYGEYDIQINEDGPGRFKAVLRRLDGASISTEPYGPIVPVLTTLAFLDRDAAIKEAKCMIDGGGMKKSEKIAVFHAFGWNQTTGKYDIWKGMGTRLEIERRGLHCDEIVHWADPDQLTNGWRDARL